MKYIKLERLTKLDKNAYKILHLFQLYFNWFLYKIIHRFDIKTSMQINHTPLCKPLFLSNI